MSKENTIRRCKECGEHFCFLCANTNNTIFCGFACEEAQAKRTMSNEELAEFYIELSGTQLHSSDCSTSIAPAETPSACDCHPSDCKGCPKPEQR